MSDFEEMSRQFVASANEEIEKLLQSLEKRGDLCSAIDWAFRGGGKRIRPQLCFGAALACGGDWRDAKPAALAIELLHTYTLVHDDLPAMDNDKFRRGLPSVWNKFGEDTAILAGDALQALAFRQAAKCPRNSVLVVAALAERAWGVVIGQVADLEWQKKRDAALDVGFVYEHKTADLFIASVRMGALAVGADDSAIASLSDYALNLGLAFQYEDDLLDGDSPLGTAATEEAARKATAAAMTALDGMKGDCAFLRELAKRLLNRRK